MLCSRLREWDASLGIPSISINLGVLSEKNGVLRIDCAARAMDDESLDILCDETLSFFNALGLKLKVRAGIVLGSLILARLPKKYKRYIVQKVLKKYLLKLFSRRS